MDLDQDQIDALFSINRNGQIDKNYRWPNKTLTYEFAERHTEEHNKYIEMALKTLESVSCLKFVRRTNEKDYVQMTVNIEKFVL